MGGIEAVELVEEWVFADLSSSSFSEDEQRLVLNDIDELEEQLTVWDRKLGNAVDILTGTGDETVYRRRVGSLRTYFVRNGDTLYCIGVGKRKKTYDRDLTQMIERARNHPSDG